MTNCFSLSISLSYFVISYLFYTTFGFHLFTLLFILLCTPLLLPLLPVIAPSFLFSHAPPLLFISLPFSTLFLLPCHLSSFSFPCTQKHTFTPGDRAGSEVRSQALVGDSQAPEGAYRQAVPRALAQPPEPRGEEDFMDRGGGPNHLPGTREAGQPLG